MIWILASIVIGGFAAVGALESLKFVRAWRRNRKLSDNYVISRKFVKDAIQSAKSGDDECINITHHIKASCWLCEIGQERARPSYELCTEKVFGWTHYLKKDYSDNTIDHQLEDKLAIKANDDQHYSSTLKVKSWRAKRENLKEEVSAK